VSKTLDLLLYFWGCLIFTEIVFMALAIISQGYISDVAVVYGFLAGIFFGFMTIIQRMDENEQD
jgi:hypothetical protein